MKFFNSIAAATTIYISLMISYPVYANTECGESEDGWSWCQKDNGDMGVDVLTYWRGDENTKLQIVCTGGGGYRYEAWGNVSKAFNDSIAEYWCGDY